LCAACHTCVLAAARLPLPLPSPHACALAVGVAAPRPAPARTSRAQLQPCAAATGYNSPCRCCPRARVAAFLMHHCCRPSSSRGPAPGPAPACPNYPRASRQPPLKAALGAVSHSASRRSAPLVPRARGEEGWLGTRDYNGCGRLLNGSGEVHPVRWLCWVGWWVRLIGCRMFPYTNIGECFRRR
jgi:hypothetical protein